jgi:hypothetical protein
VTDCTGPACAFEQADRISNALLGYPSTSRVGLQGYISGRSAISRCEDSCATLQYPVVGQTWDTYTWSELGPLSSCGPDYASVSETCSRDSLHLEIIPSFAK